MPWPRAILNVKVSFDFLIRFLLCKQGTAANLLTIHVIQFHIKHYVISEIMFSHLWWNIISSLLFTSWTNILIWKNHTYSIKNKSQKTFLITNCSYGFCVLQIKFENQSYLDLLLEASASKGIFLVSLLTLMVFTNMHATHLTKNANSLHFNIVYFFYPNWQICD